MFWRVIGTAVALVAAGVTSASAGGLAAVPCGPAAAATMAVDGQARVYVARGVFGCAHGHPAPVRLGGSRTSCLGTVRVGPVTLAGTTAAYAAERCGIDTGSTTVEVRRLTDGRELRRADAGTPPGPESYTSVTSIVVRSGGAVAWIAVSRSLGSGRESVEVWRAGRTVTRLDSGSRIDTRSLRLLGRRISWRDGGRVRSTTLG